MRNPAKRVLQTNNRNWLQPIAQSAPLDIESASPLDGLLLKIEDHSRCARMRRIAAYRLFPDFSRHQPHRHLHLPCPYGELRREGLFHIYSIYWWKGRDSKCPAKHLK